MNWLSSQWMICVILSMFPFLGFAQTADIRQSALQCQLEASSELVQCDYRYPLNIEVKDISVKVGGQTIKLEPTDIALYPAPGQTSAILILVDVSDPRRRETVEKKYVKLIKDMVADQKPHQLIGIAGFDSELNLLTPMSADHDALMDAVTKIKATGAATEYYKNILTAIELLKKTDSTRKGLVIMSDGKDEDKAYNRDDVLKAAKDAGVAILGIGFEERLSDSPYLQNVHKLAIETFGQYYDGSEGKYPASFLNQPFAFLETGGRVTFKGNKFNAAQDVTLVLGTKNDKPFEITTRVEFPDKRSSGEKFKEFVKRNMLSLLLGLVALIAVIAYAMYYLKKRKETQPQVIEYGYLEELSGAKTRHILTKTAVRIGRSIDNDVHLANDSISTHHAEIHRRREGDFYIVDLSSTNGVFVNEEKVTQTELSDGDLIELGEVRLHFYIN